MKKFLIRGILFFLLFFIVEKSAYYFSYVSPEREYDKRLESLMNGEINKELIVLGSSIGAGNIIAGQIEEQTGLSSYNLSYPGSDITFHKFILATLLEFNKKPQKIILLIDNPYEFIEVATLKYRFDRLYPLSMYNYINDELIKQNEKNEFSKLFCLARINKSNLKFGSVEIPVQNPIDASGSMPFIKRDSTVSMDFSTKVSAYSTLDELPEKLKAFEDIQRLCAEANIELIFVFSPYYRTFNDSFKNRFQKLMRSDNKIMVYDTLNPIYKNKDHYFDESHLMNHGATIFTTEITTFINNN